MRKFIGGSIMGAIGWVILPTFFALALLVGGVMYLLADKVRESA